MKSNNLAGASIKKPKRNSHPPIANQVVSQARGVGLSEKIRPRASTNMPPAVETESKEAKLPFLRRKSRVTAAESNGKKSILRAILIIS